MDTTIDYQRLADDYATHRAIHPGVLRTLIQRPNLGSTSRVVEAGCGTGNYLRALHSATGCAATGFDPSSAMLNVARSRSPELVWIEARGEAIPLPDASADLVYSVDVIHHVVDRAAYFAEVARVLVPGGLVCTATDSEDDIARRRPLSSHFPETVPIELKRYPSIPTLRAEMKDAGFSDLEETHVELAYDLTEIAGYRDKAYSSLHLITPVAHAAGITRLEEELQRGPIPALSLYTLLWGVR